MLTNFIVEFDIHAVADGGIWLRKSPTGLNGVLLVTGGEGWGPGSRMGDAGKVVYWHVVTNGTYSPYLSEVFNLFTPTVSEAHLRIVVSNNVYAAFLNGDTSPISSITNSVTQSGLVALYSYSDQTFDNFSITAIQPLLDIHNGMYLSWPAEFAGYILEETTNSGFSNWVASPYSANLVNQVVLPNDAGNKFFRLRKP